MISFGKFLEDYVRADTNVYSELKKQKKWLEEKLQSHNLVEKTFCSGSFARKTAIRPINDVDLFVVLKPQCLCENSLTDLKTVVLTFLKEILVKNVEQQELEATDRQWQQLVSGKQWKTKQTSEDCPFKSMILREQNASVGLCVNHEAWNDAKPTFDFVPAIQVSIDRYLICKDDIGVLTHPKAVELVTSRLEKKVSGFVDLVRCVKYWNSKQPTGAKFKSFHLEVVCQRIVDKHPNDFGCDCRLALAALLTKIAAVCENKYRVPGIRGSYVELLDKNIIETLRASLKTAANKLRAADKQDWVNLFRVNN